LEVEQREMTIVLWILAVIFILVGIAGIVLPAVPGIPLMFCGFLIAAWIDNFDKVGWITLSVLCVLTLISVGVDLLAASVGAKRLGASRLAIVGALVGTFVGFFMGFAGILVGPFLGAIVGEFLSRRDWIEAGKVGFGTWVGLILGTAVKLGLAFTMLSIFITSFIL